MDMRSIKLGRVLVVGQFAVAAASDRRNLLNLKAGGLRPPLQQIKLTHFLSLPQKKDVKMKVYPQK
jgi:hypothetical protein